MTNKERYIAFAAQQEVPLFFQPQWLEMTGKDWGVALAEADAKIQAVWIYTIERKIGLTLIRNPLLTPYLGPLFFLPEEYTEKKRQQAEEKLFPQLIRQLPSWDFLDVRCIPGFDHFFLFHQYNISHSRCITYHIDLTSEEHVLWNNINGKQRYAIRQGEKKLKIVDGASYADRFYELHQETLTSKGERYPYSKPFFNRLFDIAHKNGCSYARAALNDKGETAAIVFTVFDAGTMYLLLTANNKTVRHNGGVALLIWDAIKKAKELGLRTFDFEGSMDKGIEQFFRSFGGERKTYLHATSIKSRLWKLKQWIR